MRTLSLVLIVAVLVVVEETTPKERTGVVKAVANAMKKKKKKKRQESRNAIVSLCVQNKWDSNLKTKRMCDDLSTNNVEEQQPQQKEHWGRQPND